MIPTEATLCKHHGDKPKGTCPGCLRVEINKLKKERDYYKAQRNELYILWEKQSGQYFGGDEK